jgi:hypothetical protein
MKKRKKQTNASRALEALGVVEAAAALADGSTAKPRRSYEVPSKLDPDAALKIKLGTVDAAKSKRERKALKRLINLGNQLAAQDRARKANS